MNVVPWRVKNFLSRRLPLAYHIAINLGTRANGGEHWDQRLAETWDSPNRDWPTKVATLISEIPVNARVLDVACGNGSILRGLRKAGFDRLYGLELSKYAVDRLTREGIRAKQGRLPTIAFPESSFDVVIASQILEHVIRRTRFVREVHRVLRAGGRAYFFVPDDRLSPMEEPEHVIVYQGDTLGRFLSKHFAEVNVESMRDANHHGAVLCARVRR